MRANVSDELLDAINERIYLDLEVHVLTKKLNESDNEGFSNYINKLISNVIKQRKEVNDYLTSNGVKIFEVVEIDDMFVKYPYSQQINGGYKEGYQQLWKAGIKFKLKQRMANYFTGGD
jgi:hypothetical protein